MCVLRARLLCSFVHGVAFFFEVESERDSVCVEFVFERAYPAHTAASSVHD